MKALRKQPTMLALWRATFIDTPYMDPERKLTDSEWEWWSRKLVESTRASCEAVSAEAINILYGEDARSGNSNIQHSAMLEAIECLRRM